VILSDKSLDDTQLRIMLERSFYEFNVADQNMRDSIYEKYSADLNQSHLKGLEIFEDDELVASAISCYRQFYTDCGPINLSFLTQVIVQEKYRGRGYLRKLIDFAQKVDQINLSLGSIVIARRSVGTLYSKLGYLGFGVFPNISVAKLDAQEPQTPTVSIDWKLIANAYQNIYQSLPGSIYRSIEYWNYLSSEVKRGRYRLGAIKSGKELGYYFFSKEDCYEIAATTDAIVPELLKLALSQGVQNFKIPSNHPFFSQIILAGGVYTVRPEREEGHMLKPYLGGEFLRVAIKNRMSKVLSAIDDQDKFSFDINLLNEW
jgi:predicted acetyltransferase